MKHTYSITLLTCSLMLVACVGRKKPNPNLAKNLYQQSLVASEKNKREALVLIDQSLAIEPTSRAYALKATLLYQIGEYQESLKIFEKVIQDRSTPAPLKADVSNNYACTLLAIGQIEQARQTWLKLAENRFYLSPEVAWFNLGLLELGNSSKKKANKGQLAQAEVYFKKALKINPDYIDAHYYLAQTLILLNRKQEAKDCLAQIIGTMPEHQAAKQMMHKLNQG